MKDSPGDEGVSRFLGVFLFRLGFSSICLLFLCFSVVLPLDVSLNRILYWR